MNPSRSRSNAAAVLVCVVIAGCGGRERSAPPPRVDPSPSTHAERAPDLPSTPTPTPSPARDPSRATAGRPFATVDLALPRRTSEACVAGARRANVTALPQPRTIPSRFVGRCTVVHGWWGFGALLVPETREGIAGFRVIRSFAFVRSTNDSLGAPSWFALSAIFVDVGFVTADPSEASPVREADYDPLFEESTRLDGTLVRLDEDGFEAIRRALVAISLDFDASPDAADYRPYLLRLPERG